MLLHLQRDISAARIASARAPKRLFLILPVSKQEMPALVEEKIISAR